ncbi:hypothetical protein [Burkholderia sp. A9]|uniref:hypothetical protein n=1 Tax=Burkholderia sp. A9 TaxID=1365108 RepID=UPI00126A3215|nr:hypothetical protein [Burkholderia sp. A9]
MSKLGEIDRGQMLFPATPDNWDIAGPDSIRYGWDPDYINRRGQTFSPWYFAKNCSAVLGHVRAHGKSALMAEMAESIFSVLSPHIHTIANYRYVRNDFKFNYLWHQIEPPFYGAFMNNVTAQGLLHLFEATGIERYLLLADRFMMTSVDPNAPIPLCSIGSGDFWLHEYVFRLEPTVRKWVKFNRSGEWFMARIFNGHIHALLPLMRIKEMTGTRDYDGAISWAVDTMRDWIPTQEYEGRYFSYSPDLPVYPDYGQKRAVHLAESLAKITDDPELMVSSNEMRAFWTQIEEKEKELLATAMEDTKNAHATALIRLKGRGQA